MFYGKSTYSISDVQVGLTTASLHDTRRRQHSS